MNTRQYAVLIAGIVALSAGAAAALPAGALGSQAQDTATVSFADQTAEDDTVTVESAALPEGGFVVIHESDDGEAGDVVGVSEYLEPGESEDVEVELDEDVEDEEEFVAMAHFDSDDNEAFDFVESDGEEDGPYTADGEAVVDSATVTAEADEDDAEDEEDEDETEEETDEADEDEADDEADEEDETEEEAEEADEDEAEDEEDEGNETDEAAVDGLAVTELEAPTNATVGETLNVSATVENQGESETTERVEFRVDGELVANQEVTAEADEEATVSFAVDTGLQNLSEGEFQHGVFTESDWELGTIGLEQSFGLVDLDAPENATVGETVTANATVRNPNEAEATQTVAFRFDGGVADSSEVTLDGGAEETVSLDVNASGVEPGNYTHGVFTVTDGAFADIELVPAPPEGAIAFENQTVDDDTVTIESVSVDEGGFVVIHDDSLLDGDAVGSVIGVSEYLEPGEYEDIEVDLFDVPGADFENESLDGNATLIAMPHLDTNDNETYDFVATDGEADGPYTDAEGNATLDEAAVTVEQPDTETETEAETETPATEGETEEPATEEETEEPATEEETEEPATEEATEEPATEEPVTEDGTVEEPEEPVPVAPATEDTATEEETEEPGTEEPATEEPDTEEPTTEEPVPEGTETEDGTAEPGTEENETTDEGTETPEDEAEATATVDLADQATNGTTVTVDSVNVSEGGFVVVYNVSLLDGDAVESVIGVSEYLEPGEYEDLEIGLFDVPGVEYERDQLGVGQTVYAMPHRDTDGNEEYDFAATNGSADGPYTDADGDAIVDDGNLVIESDE